MSEKMDVVEKDCPHCNVRMRRVGWTYRCESSACVSNGGRPDPLPIQEGPETVTIQKQLYDNLMRYYREGEQAKKMLRNLGYGQKGMTLLMTVIELNSSIRDSNGLGPNGTNPSSNGKPTGV